MSQWKPLLWCYLHFLPEHWFCLSEFCPCSSQMLCYLVQSKRKYSGSWSLLMERCCTRFWYQNWEKKGSHCCGCWFIRGTPEATIFISLSANIFIRWALIKKEDLTIWRTQAALCSFVKAVSLFFLFVLLLLLAEYLCCSFQAWSPMEWDRETEKQRWS